MTIDEVVSEVQKDATKLEGFRTFDKNFPTERLKLIAFLGCLLSPDIKGLSLLFLDPRFSYSYAGIGKMFLGAYGNGETLSRSAFYSFVIDESKTRRDKAPEKRKVGDLIAIGAIAEPSSGCYKLTEFGEFLKPVIYQGMRVSRNLSDLKGPLTDHAKEPDFNLERELKISCLSRAIGFYYGKPGHESRIGMVYDIFKKLCSGKNPETFTLKELAEGREQMKPILANYLIQLNDDGLIQYRSTRSGELVDSQGIPFNCQRKNEVSVNGKVTRLIWDLLFEPLGKLASTLEMPDPFLETRDRYIHSRDLFSTDFQTQVYNYLQERSAGKRS